MKLHRGLEVTYIPRHARGSESHPDRELGIVTSWNDRFVFVNYGDGSTSKATRREDLEIGDQTFYCPDEHNSVLDGAFGRCEHQCNNCSTKEEFIKNI